MKDMVNVDFSGCLKASGALTAEGAPAPRHRGVLTGTVLNQAESVWTKIGPVYFYSVGCFQSLADCCNNYKQKTMDVLNAVLDGSG